MIDKLKESYDVNDSQVARLLGVYKSTVSRYKNGKQVIPDNILKHIDSLIRHDAKTRERIKRERI